MERPDPRTLEDVANPTPLGHHGFVTLSEIRACCALIARELIALRKAGAQAPVAPLEPVARPAAARQRATKVLMSQRGANICSVLLFHAGAMTLAEIREALMKAGLPWATSYHRVKGLLQRLHMGGTIERETPVGGRITWRLSARAANKK